jgi:hypothetical protein
LRTAPSSTWACPRCSSERRLGRGGGGGGGNRAGRKGSSSARVPARQGRGLGRAAPSPSRQAPPALLPAMAPLLSPAARPCPLTALAPSPRPPRLGDLVDDLAARLARGDSVYLHCWGGRGRAGTVGACLIAKLYGCAAGAWGCGPAGVGQRLRLSSQRAARRGMASPLPPPAPLAHPRRRPRRLRCLTAGSPPTRRSSACSAHSTRAWTTTGGRRRPRSSGSWCAHTWLRWASKGRHPCLSDL